MDIESGTVHERIGIPLEKLGHGFHKGVRSAYVHGSVELGRSSDYLYVFDTITQERFPVVVNGKSAGDLMYRSSRGMFATPGGRTAAVEAGLDRRGVDRQAR